MGKRSFLSFIAKRFSRKKAKTNEKSEVISATISNTFQWSVPVTEMVVATELSQGLGRTIPYYNNNNFTGIVTFKKVQSSGTSSVQSNMSNGKFEHCDSDLSHTRPQKIQDQGNSDRKQPKPFVMQNQNLNPLDKQFQEIYNLSEPTRSLLIADICKPMTNWDLYHVNRD